MVSSMPDSLSPAKQPSAYLAVVGIGASGMARSGYEPRIAELEHELGAMRAELADAACRSEASGDEQKAMNEELAAHNNQLLESLALVQGLLAKAVEERAVEPPDEHGIPVIVIVDDDAAIRTGLRGVLEAEGHTVEDYASSDLFLQAYQPGRHACLLVDATLPGSNGRDRLASLERGAGQAADSGKLLTWRTDAARAVHGLTTRQREVMALVIAGHPSKNIAADLGISQRTVENHRAAIMGRTGCKSLPALARLALAAAWTGSDHSLVAAGPGGPGGR